MITTNSSSLVLLKNSTDLKEYITSLLKSPPNLALEILLSPGNSACQGLLIPCLSQPTLKYIVEIFPGETGNKNRTVIITTSTVTLLNASAIWQEKSKNP